MTTPNQPIGLTDFFALEAGEYLERLDAVLQAADGPAVPGEDAVKLARALRGAALMASKAPIAHAAAGFEALARAVKDGRRPWDPATRQTAIRAVDDLKVFVRRAATWTDADTAKAEALGTELERLAGRTSGAARVEAPGLDAGARAFVAREGAAIASALDRAANALRANPAAHDPLTGVLRALQPLRGLAALADLPPLPDLLEGIERAIAELERSGGRAGPAPAELFQSAAAAIAAASREVADRGRPTPEAPEFRAFAGLLVRALDADADVVPITTLYYGDAGPHIVHQGTPAARPATLGRLELVSHGEHLRQAADSLERAPSATQRELRAHTLAGTFRALVDAGGDALAAAAGRFAASAREAVGAGTAVQRAAEFAALLRRAGDVLARSSSGDDAALAAELDGVTADVERLGAGAPVAAAPEPPVVPIESLAPEAPAPAAPLAAPAAVALAEETPESDDLAGSWSRYERLAAAGFGPASLEALLAGPSPIAVAARPVPRPAPAPAPAAAPAAAEPAVVDIRTLLYRGERAARRAQELREAAKHVTGDALRELVAEACDLVVLATEPAP